MGIVLVLIILVFVGGIILINGKTPFNEKPREQFLKELAKALEGTIEPIEEEEGNKSFRVLFRFNGENFVYEDLEKQGFKDKFYKAYLKVKTTNKLTLTFIEKKRSTKIKMDIFIVSDVSTRDISPDLSSQLPPYLKDLKVFTNDPGEVNRILEDRKVLSVFKKFRNIDARGYPFLSIGIINGEVILEFSSTKTVNPNLPALRAEVSLMEDCLEQMMIIVRKLKSSN